MWFSFWLRTRKTNRKHQPASRFRPRFEVLEQRSMLAALAVTTAADVLDADDGLLSLREAVLQANSSPGADTIDLTAGDYVLSLGQLEIRDDLTIAGAGAANPGSHPRGPQLLVATYIDADQSSRVLQIVGAQVNIAHVGVVGGRASRGAGIDVVGGNLHITNSLILGNRALSSDGTDALGGGIYNQGGTVTITHSDVVDNRAFTENSGSALGGGICNDGGILTVTASLFVSNETRISYGNTGSALGGGIYNAGGNVVISNGNFVRNLAISDDAGRAGGAHVYHGGGALTITNTEFFDGRAASDFGDASGGAIYIVGGSVTITNTTLGDNVATSFEGQAKGRAIYIVGGSLRITNCTFLRNGPGALYIDGGTVCVSRNTIFVDGFNNADPDAILGPYTLC